MGNSFCVSNFKWIGAFIKHPSSVLWPPSPTRGEGYNHSQLWLHPSPLVLERGLAKRSRMRGYALNRYLSHRPEIQCNADGFTIAFKRGVHVHKVIIHQMLAC